MTTTTNAFDLRDLIREVLEELDVCDVRKIAIEVSRRTEQRHLREAFDQALPVVVQNTISRDRRFAPRARDTREDDAKPEVAPLIPAQRKNSGTGGGAVGSSWKTDGFRKHAAELAKPYATGFDPGSHKPLGKFTVDNCITAESMSRKLAEGNIHSAEKWARYRKALVESKVTKIEDLPDTVLDAIMGGVS